MLAQVTFENLSTKSKALDYVIDKGEIIHSIMSNCTVFLSFYASHQNDFGDSIWVWCIGVGCLRSGSPGGRCLLVGAARRGWPPACLPACQPCHHVSLNHRGPIELASGEGQSAGLGAGWG